MYFHYLRTKKKYLLKGVFFLLIIFSSFPLKALQASIVHNVFFMPSGEKNAQLAPYIEVYWQIDPKSILFKKENEIWKGKIKTQIIISNKEGIVKNEQYILETPPVSQEYQIPAQNIIDLRRYALPEGHFTIEVIFSDLFKNENKFKYSDTFSVLAPVKEPFFSDIQIIDTSFASAQESIFSRNGKLQIPLCTNFLDEHRRSLHYYAELYNTVFTSEEKQPLTRKVFISRREYDIPLSQLTRTDTLSTSLIEIIEGKFSTATLPSGNYFLNMIVENKDHERLAAKSFFFQLLNPHPEINSIAKVDTSSSNIDAPSNYLNLNKTFVAKYTPEQIRAILKMLIPIANPTERNAINDFLKHPDEMYSRYFVYNFWLGRNKLSPEKEWKEYSEKVKEVNKLFGSSMMPGYETERGNIYLKYGKPSERNNVVNENGALPYEIWLYNSLPQATNAIFLFYRPGFVTNEYVLLHSTVNGERRNKNWRSILYLNSTEETLNSSRAEQYIGNR